MQSWLACWGVLLTSIDTSTKEGHSIRTAVKKWTSGKLGMCWWCFVSWVTACPSELNHAEDCQHHRGGQEAVRKVSSMLPLSPEPSALCSHQGHTIPCPLICAEMNSWGYRGEQTLNVVCLGCGAVRARFTAHPVIRPWGANLQSIWRVGWRDSSSLIKCVTKESIIYLLGCAGVSLLLCRSAKRWRH